MASDPNSGDPGPLPVPATPPAGPVALSGLTMDSAVAQGLVTADEAAAAPPTDAGGSAIAVVRDTPIDKTRQRLAFILLATLLIIIAVEMGLSALFAASCWRGGDCATNIEPAMQVMTGAVQPLFTAMVGLVGSVVGFYFGSKNS